MAPCNTRGNHHLQLGPPSPPHAGISYSVHVLTAICSHLTAAQLNMVVTREAKCRIAQENLDKRDWRICTLHHGHLQNSHRFGRRGLQIYTITISITLR